ncbi:Probable inactive receptor kinase At5g67200 [Linum perenne]
MKKLLLPLLFLLSFSPFLSSSLHHSEDAQSLLTFKSKADLNGLLLYSRKTSPQFCRLWQGVECLGNRVVRLVLQDLPLGGVFATDTLTRLDQLRVLSLQNNSLTGPIPDLSSLVNLKSLFLDHNYFSGSFPPSLASLHRLRTLDLSFNSLSGSLPSWLTSLDRLNTLRLEWNRFNDSIPPLNQSSLMSFNVSHNNLTGAIPVTPTFLRLQISSFSVNPNLCGKIVHKECRPGSPFFGYPSPALAAPPPSSVQLGQSADLHGVSLSHPAREQNQRRKSVIIGLSIAAFALFLSLLCFAMAMRKKQKNNSSKKKKSIDLCLDDAVQAVNDDGDAVMQIDQKESELEEKVKKAQGLHMGKSGNLMFCAGEAQVYTLDQLMRASAELLGKGTVGTTYKAVLDDRLIVCVKRLDAGRLSSEISKESFERHMESVGGLRHPNLVPLRAYFQARQERLLVYDYQPNGSLHSLIHGSKSARGKPLHWTSCLKIAEDVAQGLAYIHQAWRLVHGNLKSTNVLLGPDFEACVADYCLAVLAEAQQVEDQDAAAYKAPEVSNVNGKEKEGGEGATAKGDVYAFGILLMELLTGKVPSELVFMMPEEMMKWVRCGRDGDMEEEEGKVDGEGSGNKRMEMLLEVAVGCRTKAAEQRPTMWQVLKMLQEIKETVSMEDDGEVNNS